MKQLILTLGVLFLVLTGCRNYKQEAGTLQQQNDSLRKVTSQLQNETNDYISTMNDINANFQKIKEMENYIQANKSQETANPDIKAKINDDILLIADILKKNKEQIASLTNKLNNSSVKIKALEETVERLNTELNDKVQQLQSLSQDLQMKDAKIADLSKNMDELNTNIKQLQNDKQTQQNQIVDQDTKLYSGWYVIGTSKELKTQKIITGGGLFTRSKLMQSDFNQDYFEKIDIRQVQSIPLNSKSAKVLTTHPQGSYSLDKESNGNYVLTIKDYKTFWSVSRYLVVQVS